MKNLQLILGGPGCGKTRRLLEIVAEEMHHGVPASAIAFVTFTKAAANEAKERAAEQFSLDPEKDLPWFRTIHSLAYARLGMHHDEVMSHRDWREFGEIVGEPMTGKYSPIDGVVSTNSREIGDSMLRIVDFAATTLTTLRTAWHHLDEAIDWHRLVRFSDALRLYKEDSDKVDFSDMLRMYLETGETVPVQVAIIDEAQDLTAAQWAVARRAFADVERIYVAGDDDQAIYHWAGADVTQFLNLSGAPEVLPMSHRLPVSVHAIARDISARISKRYAKRFVPSPRDGSVTWHQHPESIDFHQTGSWFLLARNTYMLSRLEAIMRAAGVNYSRRSGAAVVPLDVVMMQMWERLRSGKVADIGTQDAKALLKLLELPLIQMKEMARHTLSSLGVAPERIALPWHAALTGIPLERREYYLMCLRRGEKLTTPPRIRIETIHGVKGAQADHVMLMTDLSARTAHSFRLSPDNEHRVFYVGATRAFESLHIVMPQSSMFYPL